MFRFCLFCWRKPLPYTRTLSQWALKRACTRAGTQLAWPVLVLITLKTYGGHKRRGYLESISTRGNTPNNRCIKRKCTIPHLLLEWLKRLCSEKLFSFSLHNQGKKEHLTSLFG